MSDATLNVMQPARLPRVLVSILNWNGTAKTLACLDSVKNEVAVAPAEVTTLVIDNGSRSEEAAALSAALGARDVVLKCLPQNLGFTGGHNVAIELAIREDYDYIWLLNNDSTVELGTLRELVAELQAHARCGAVSPVLRDIHDGHIARCVNYHDWDKRKTRLILDIEEARRFQDAHPEEVWVDGTAVLYRVQALKDTGPLDDRLFAYYDDDDISMRLVKHGWMVRCALNATVFHENRKELEEFPLYLVYLLQRNEMLFLDTHTPPAYRRLLRLKLVDKAMYDAVRYREYGRYTYSDAALLGMWDYLRGRFGPPAHQRKVPLLLRTACVLAQRVYAIKNANARKASRRGLAPEQHQST
jgi:GT2 family glycosyltransferase